MLKNTFRKLVGILILVVFGVAIYRYAQQTSGNPYVAGAIFSGAKFLLFIALVLWVVYMADRRMKKREE